LAKDIKIYSTKFDNVKLFELVKFDDNRGFFVETFNYKIQKLIDPKIKFIQDNESFSKYGVLRGLHFQKSPYQQAKLIRVSDGEIQDVIVDVRPNSKTYGEWQSFILSSTNNKVLYVPKGFAHGFLVLSKTATVNYKTDSYYNHNSESGIIYNDKTLNIEWELPKKNISISEKDKQLPFF